jgi:hypothetical protein
VIWDVAAIATLRDRGSGRFAMGRMEPSPCSAMTTFTSETKAVTPFDMYSTSTVILFSPIYLKGSEEWVEIPKQNNKKFTVFFHGILFNLRKI